MRILSKEEAADLIPLTNGRETKASAMMKQLKPGEALTILKTEWRTKYPPSTIANKLARKYGWKFTKGRMPDGSGWFIRRES